MKVNIMNDNELHCPHCGYESMEHVQTFMYCRHEDQEGVFVTSDPLTGLVSQSKLEKDDEGRLYRDLLTRKINKKEKRQQANDQMAIEIDDHQVSEVEYLNCQLSLFC